MEYFLDITTESFEALQNHETTELVLEKEQQGSWNVGDSFKLYHPGNPYETLRVEIISIRQEQEKQIIDCRLLEWIFRMETELDELLREEEKWMNNEL